MAFKMTILRIEIAVFLSLASHDTFGPLRGVLSGNDHDIWPFDDLNKDMDAKGKATNTWSPVGQGLYLDGTDDTYVKLKKHDKNCLEHPSKCDITIGFFLKFHPPSGLQIYFGNMDDDGDRYEGINIYHDGQFRVEVYGKDKYCARVISPPQKVWFYLGLVWEKNGNLAVYVDKWYSQSSWDHNQCGKSPSGLKKHGDYYLGRYTYPVAFYKDLNIWSSKQSKNVLDQLWDAAFEITGSTEIGLKIIFPDLAFNSGNAALWSVEFSDQLDDLYAGNIYLKQIKDITVTDSNGQASVSFKLKFSEIFWKSVLDLQLAMENGTLLGYPAVMDEASCQTGSHEFICEAPKKAYASFITSNLVKVTMDKVSVPLHDSYFYGYRILHKNLEDEGSEWTARGFIRKNVDPITGDVSGLIPYTNYSFRVFAKSFRSVGLISEPFKVRTLEWVPDIGPDIIACNYTNSSSIYVEWVHSIPRRNVRGVLVGYRVAWDEDYFSSGDGNDSGGYADVGLDTSNYNITSLHEYWLYNIHVAGRTSVGPGTYTSVTVRTGEDVPSAPPSHVQLHAANESALNAYWRYVPLIHQNGVILGYRLLLQQEDGGPVVWNVTVGPDVHWYMFTNLEIFQTYSTQILAFTIKGEGPLSAKVYQKTDGSVPINSPVNLTAHNVSSREIEVSWDYNEDPRLVLGDLTGFWLYFLEANASDFFPDDAIATRHHKGTRRSARVGGLQIFRLYNISVAAVTNKGPGPTNESVVVRTDGEVPGAPPQAFAAYSTGPSSIYVSWQEIEANRQHGIMLGYKLFFYEVTGQGRIQIMENYTFGLAVHEKNVTGLEKFTKYRAVVHGFNNYGDGPFGVEEAFTEEGTPSQHPGNFTAFNISSTIIRATWRPVPVCCRLGFIRGYHVTLTDSSNSSSTITNTVSELFTRFIDLKKFHIYQLSITAFTSKGSGPSAIATASTDQDVPEAPPQNVSGYNMSQTEIQLLWAPVPADKENGIVMGYKVCYRNAPASHHVGYKSFNSSTFQGVIDGLSPFTIYNIDVRAFTIKGDGVPSPFITVQTEEEAPQVTPTAFQGFNSSSTSIVLSWDPIPQWQVAGILRNFHITYRALSNADNTTYNTTLPITDLTLEITNLQKYTNYSFDIKGATKFIGAATEPIIVTTDEDVPSLPPQDIKVQNSSSTSISVHWKPIPKYHVNGILLGLKLFYRSATRDNSIVFSSRTRRSAEEDWSEYTIITLHPDALSYEMTSLKKFTNYSVSILGFTSKGDGNVSQQFVVSTDEDVPSMPPSNFMPITRSGDFKMSATWGPVPDGFVHGILLGYHIYYTKIQQTGRPVTTQIEKEIFGPYDYNTTILLLDNFAIYNLEIAAFTIKGDGVRSQIEDGSTCNCPRVFKTTWYPFPPYITYEDGAVGGFIPRILEDAVEYCCSDCLLPNGKSASVINFELDGRENPALKSGVEALISSIDSMTDFSVPVNGYQGQTHYSIYRYVKLAESPGVAFITVMDPSEKASAIANVFIQSWPLLILTFIMMLVAGMVMWMMESRSNRTEFPRSFFQGASEGFWWAFVTSTTVGYGDRCPKWLPSRFFAIAWTMCGLVVIAILTGKIATALTDFGYTGPYIPLYGAEVAAIANNSDFRLGVRKNARMNTVRNYRTYEEISQALKVQEVKGALVDLYVLSSHKHLFDDPRFRIVRVYDYKASYGVVLAGHSMKLEDCFTEHIKAFTASVFQKIEENVKILREPDYSPAEQQSTNLFAVSSPQFITAVIIIATLLLLACVLGIIQESRRRKSRKVLKQSEDLKNEMSPLVDSFLLDIKKKVEALSKRHRQDRCHVMRMEREREQQAGYAVNKYYQVLSLRDIRQQWSHRPLSVKSVASSLNGKTSYNPTLWPFTSAAKPLSPNVTPSWKQGALPSKRKQGFDLPAAPVTLEPNVRVIDETSL